MGTSVLISADSHIYEPPDLWATHIDARYKSRAPRLVAHPDGDWWECEGRAIQMMGSGANPGTRYRTDEEMNPGQHFTHVLPGGYDPHERVKDMDRDGISAEVIYPTATLGTYRCVEDNYLLDAVFRAYNDWLASFCSAYPKRLKGMGLINVDHLAQAVKELERIKKNGLAGALISVHPPMDLSYDRAEYDPFWAAAEGLQLPLGMHLVSNRPGPGQDMLNIKARKPGSLVNADHWVRVSLANMIASGVFARFPLLKVVSVEHGTSWVPHFLERMDFMYKGAVRRGPVPYSVYGWYQYEDGMLPSDVFHRNVFVTFEEDPFGVRNRDAIGVGNMCWGSDYPHPESTFPHSIEVLERIFAGVPTEEKERIVGGNIAHVYGIESEPSTDGAIATAAAPTR